MIPGFLIVVVAAGGRDGVLAVPVEILCSSSQLLSYG
jgi:hypothetical protein